VAHAFSQVQQLGLEHASAAEHQQLLGQGGGPFRGEMDALGRLLQFALLLQPRDQHAGVPLDDREHVVEIMRHARREMAERIHLLRLPQLGLQALLLGDILDVAMDPLGGGDGLEFPFEVVLRHLRFGLDRALAAQRRADDLMDVRGQQKVRVVQFHPQCQVEGGFVAIGHRGIWREFQNGVRVQLGEGGQRLHFRLGLKTVVRGGQVVGAGHQKLKIVPGELPRFGGMDGQQAEGAIATPDGDTGTAAHLVFGEQRRFAKPLLPAPIRHDRRLVAGEYKPGERNRTHQPDSPGIRCRCGC